MGRQFFRDNWVEIVRIIVMASIIGLVVAGGVRGCRLVNAAHARRAVKLSKPKIVKLPCGQKVVSAGYYHSGKFWAVRPMLPDEQPVVVTIVDGDGNRQTHRILHRQNPLGVLWSFHGSATRRDIHRVTNQQRSCRCCSCENQRG